ncbi:hypothetical protein [Fischerella thermalis]|uniref:hypothetical protein n=1 Tax=Fischerella thermalis TaxID=372787 RepID=UPI001F208790|nr:hypothetical protein [Fischerella thermalis]
MGWLKRLFGLEKPQNAQVNPAPQTIQQQPSAPAATQQIAPERMGLNGEYDQSGLAKRVALAFDQDNQLDDIDTDTFLLTFINKYTHKVRAYQPMHEGKSLAHHLDPLALLARQMEI